MPLIVKLPFCSDLAVVEPCKDLSEGPDIPAFIRVCSSFFILNLSC